jgi:hypothetical protein
VSERLTQLARNIGSESGPRHRVLSTAAARPCHAAAGAGARSPPHLDGAS